MANPSVTYTFANSTTADGTQVTQNFTDVINSLTDGTKDLTISALTCGGTVTLNGSVLLGNGTPDDISVLGSLATSIPIKTTFTYDIGSATLGLRDVYYGSSDSAAKSTKVRAGTVGTSNTITLPTITGTLDLVKDKPYELTNLSVSASVSANALTIALKTKAGTDATTSDPIYVGFRSATVTSGVYVQRSVTAALSAVISSGSTLGHVSAVNQYVYVYLIDNAGTLEIAYSKQRFDDGSVQSTTAEGGAGAADSASVLYSTTARSNVAVRLICRLKSSQATAGTWATAIAEISLFPFLDPFPRSEIRAYAHAGYGSTDTHVPYFTTVETETGSAMTKTTNNSTNGLKITINEDGIYSFTFEWTSASGGRSQCGLTKNATSTTDTTANPSDVAQSKRLCAIFDEAVAADNSINVVSWTGFCAAGDVIRPQTDAGAPSSNDRVSFQAVQIQRC